MSVYAKYDEPLYGRSGEPVTGATLTALIDRQINPSASDRKQRAAVAHAVYSGHLADLIIRAVGQQQNSATLKRDLKPFISAIRNDARDVTESVAVVYKNGAIRNLGGDGDESDTEVTEQEATLRTLALECALDEIGVQISHLGWLQGAQFAVPMVRRDRLNVDVVGPHIYDLVQDEDDPLGLPVGLAWPVSTTKLRDGLEEHRIYVLDGVSLRLFRVRTSSVLEVEREVEHSHGVLPAAPLRFARPLVGDDWHVVDQQRRLIEGTIEIGVILARLGLVRKTQCHRLMSLIGDLSTMPRGAELGDPETVVKADTGARPATKAPEVKVHDRVTPPDAFIRHVLFIVQCMIEPYGGHVQVDSGQPDIFGKIVIPHDTQAEHRRRQLTPTIAFERALWSAIVAMLRAESHPLAFALPLDIGDRLRVNFGELTRAVEDPVQHMTVVDWKLKRGLTSEVQLVREAHGGVPSDEAWRTIERRLDERARFNEMASERNLVTTIDGSVQRTPEANGAMGTPAREQNRAQAQDEQQQAGGPDAAQPT